MNSLSIRLLTSDDLEFADSLRAAEGWNQTRADWERLLAHQPDGCFLASWDDRPAGVVTTTVHDGTLGWIGMMLVAPEYRRRGIATALIEQCLEYFQQLKVSCVKLDATPAGTPVYEKLGFQTEWSWQRRALESEIVPQIPLSGGESFPRYNWDADIFGADRHAWLSRVAANARVVCRESGYGMLRQGSRAGYVGPISTRDESTADEIIQELLTNLEGHYLWDLPMQNRHGIELAESLGFRSVRDLNRMWTGERLIVGQPEWQYGYADPGTG